MKSTRHSLRQNLRLRCRHTLPRGHRIGMSSGNTADGPPLGIGRKETLKV